MTNIKRSALELIGNTPLLELSHIEKEYGLEATLLGKMEYLNATGSVKDRIARKMIEDAEERGILKEGSIIIEPTSGNTGIGLASVGTAKGYEVIIVMPETFSIERRKLIRAYGAKIVLSEGKLGMKGAIAKAEELAKENPNSFIPAQFDNPANWKAHYETTGKSAGTVPCTGCKYCMSKCPMGLEIPRILELYNEHAYSEGGFIAPMAMANWEADKLPSACIGCGACAAVCPQQIDIPGTMSKFAEMLAKGEE